MRLTLEKRLERYRWLDPRRERRREHSLRLSRLSTREESLEQGVAPSPLRIFSDALARERVRAGRVVDSTDCRVGLAAVALGALGAAFIDADPIMTPRAQATPVGRAHTVLGGVCLAGFPPAALLAGVGVATALGWTLAIASVVPWAGLVWFLRAAAPAHGQGGSPEIRIGWPDRFCLLAYLAWVVLAAVDVLSAL